MTISEEALEGFASAHRGELIGPADAAYDEARALFNGMIDKRPALIARVSSAADVIAAVNFGRDNGLDIAVRGGGHSGAGMSSVDDGLVIDFSTMKGVRVNPSDSTVRVEPGCSLADLDHATSGFGLIVPAGTVGSTGVAGLALGGGVGHLTRRYGMTVDNFVSVDMVLADGSFVTASDDENSDLFWAVKGGGGNFGVVTSFEFQAYSVNMVHGGPIFWSLDDAPAVMRWWSDYISDAPETVSGFFIYLRVPAAPIFPAELHGQPVAGIVWCLTGTDEENEAVLSEVRANFPPLDDHAGKLPFKILNTLFDGLMPSGMQWYWRADFFDNYSDEAVETSVDWASKIPPGLSQTHIYPVSGAASRVAENATPYGNRSAKWSSVTVGVHPDPANAEVVTNWAKDFWSAMHPHSMGGAYVNFMMDEGQDRVKAAYRGNYARLTQVKAKYDPSNLFHVNQNITPANG